MTQTTATLPNRSAEAAALDQRFMQQALNLAHQGVGQVSPGPLVGCVIVSKGEVVGEGFYVYEKLKHAETYALEQANVRAKGATAYVSLEPHAHHGRTPPCTDALIAAGIGRVVSPVEDPNPKVSGKGFAHLRAAGIEVEVGLLECEARKLNEKYFHFMATGRPFVHLKLAASLDGKIATRTGESQWITGPESRARVHEFRHEYDAILIGSGTALADDPLLSDRSGRIRGKQLIRILLDDRLSVEPGAKLIKTANETPLIVYCAGQAEPEKIKTLQHSGVDVCHQIDSRSLLSVLSNLGERSIQSVLVEGGASVAGAFFEAGLVNKISFFLAPIVIGGREAPGAVGGQGAERLSAAWKLKDVEIHRHGDDLEITGYPTND